MGYKKSKGGPKGIINAIQSILDRNRLGELLVLRGIITPHQLRYALVRQRDTNTPLGRVLMQEQMIRRRQLYSALVQQNTFRTLAAIITISLSVSALGIKPAKAAGIRDIPAQISLVNVANAAFAPVNAYPALFGSQERRSANLKPFTKWTSMFDRFESSMATASSQDVMGEMKAELVSLKGLPLSTMAQRVNTMMNRTPYILDNQNWGQSDYWATPVEFMKRGGDCEDFAIAKYVALRALGVPEERLRIAIVHDLQKDIPHAVLIVYADEGAMILDNQSSDARMADSVNRYRPIFSINRSGWWLHTAPKGTVLASAQ